jgi:hypothetical protein
LVRLGYIRGLKHAAHMWLTRCNCAACDYIKN